LQHEAADRVNNPGLLNIGFPQKGFFLDGERNWMRPIHGDGLNPIVRVARMLQVRGFEMDFQCTDLSLVLALRGGVAGAEQAHDESECAAQIEIESIPTNQHSALNNRNANSL
jgi:hypothetical protein